MKANKVATWLKSAMRTGNALPITSSKPPGKASYAPDGVLAGDWRRVRKCPSGGRVKAWGCWWESPALAPYVDNWVWVQAGEYWVVWIWVRDSESGDVICRIGNDFS